jgi:large subunit ribosomal protein L2
MGKRIIPRARGKGGPRYVAPSHRYLGKIEYSPFISISGRVVDITRDVGRSAPIAIIKLDNGKEILHIAQEGLSVGQTINYDGEISIGNVAELDKIPVGTKICGIETYPMSGPKLCRSSGTFALVVGKTENKVRLQFAHGKLIEFNKHCRATIGVPASGGREEKPWMKAGQKVHAMMARGRLFPRSAGVAMTATDHPYGGRSKRPRPSKNISRNAPPGAKVGSISPRRMGKRK